MKRAKVDVLQELGSTAKAWLAAGRRQYVDPRQTPGGVEGVPASLRQERGLFVRMLELAEELDGERSA